MTGFKSTSLESGKNTVIIPVNCVFIVLMIHVFHHALIWLELLAQQLRINFQRFEKMLTQNMSYVEENHSARSAYGSYQCHAGQVGVQPPTTYRMGEGMPMYTHLMQPATAPCMKESALLNGCLPPTTLLTPTKPANLQNADKESCAEEGWLDDDKFGAEDKGPSQD